ncbi:phosphonate ABC transporter ATP-binding protein [Anoxynatronum buryatiense]|uniref:Phosphonate transport system ATP-binding protein n=1 Tax=Anoxynatronum buryatiense TaxID=489973 RepID=A0AA45WVU7_9CLOT|nr:phosphonate ABC transporter ATP-binding protein [Anoxynatronum buryatiense]SMP50840.1 phosphonate transport system ATP-binding protein [Anoxynatronum buryatiense]
MLKVENLQVIYDNKTLALDDVSLTVAPGEFVGIIGSSGSGKSTLLKCMNLLVRPTRGKVHLEERDLMSLNSQSLRKVRREIGFIFQDYNLIDRSTVIDNVLIGRLSYKTPFQSLFRIFSQEDYVRAEKALSYVALEEKMYERADRLSGGQKQRVAIAKTLCQRPKVMLADEPVASLDQATAHLIMEYFRRANLKKNITILINLHDVALAKAYCSRIVGLKKGKVVYDGKAGDLTDDILKRLYE